MDKQTNNENDKVNDELIRQGIIRPMSITAKAVVLDDQENVLLLKRSKHELTNKKMWDLPGGGLDKEQTIEENLVREVKEEAGITVKPGPVIRVVEFEKDHESFQQEKRGLRYIAWAQETNIKLSSEHDEYVWLKLDQAIEKFSDKKGFEKEKKETLIVAKEYLEMQQAEQRWKRTLADFENFKKRTEKSNFEFRKFCLEGFVLELLPVLDNFEMATGHVPEDQKDSPWLTGIMHIKKQLENVLASQGIVEIKAGSGEKIDTTKHEIVSSSEKGRGTKIAKVLKKGYELNGKVIRPAIVEAK